MDMDLGSLSESGGSTASSPPKLSPESLNSLKFGRKIYFEDVGIGVSAKSGGDSSSSVATPPKKMRSGGAQGYQPPLCQVEGCEVDLSDAKAYYSRHKVCGMHSKSPKVIVGGIEQRFCQQCSRFHQLPEFDQGKRSCRRRLAGHNERRRKPPSGSLFSTRYGKLTSSTFENRSRVGSFLMDFSAHPKPPGRDGWSTSSLSECHVSSHTSNAVGKYHPHPWQNTYEICSSDLFLQSSLGGTHFPGPEIPLGECISADSDSTRALSLLSNESWGCRNRTSTLAFNALEEAPMAQTTAHGDPNMSHSPATFWYFKGNGCQNSSQEMAPDPCLSRMSQPLSNTFNSAFTSGTELSQENKRQYVELGQTRAFDSSIQHMHWPR